MRVEIRKARPEGGGMPIPRGLVLVAETPEESDLIDQCCGRRVGKDGLIATGEFEVRLSDGYGEHYIYIKVPK